MRQLREAGVQKSPDRKGEAVFSPQRSFSDPLNNYWDDRDAANHKLQRALSLSPHMNLRNEKFQTWQGGLPVSQVECYAHIPGYDKALSFILSVSA
jgi:hypothetical protein